MISKGSCDTEDWSNALHHINKLHLKNLKIQNSYCNISQYFYFYYVSDFFFYAALVSIMGFFKTYIYKKKKKNYQPQIFEW